MNKVYIVVEESGSGSDIERTITCFSTREKARKFFDEKVEDIKSSSYYRDADEDDSGIYIVDTEDFFSFYDDYTFNEETVALIEEEVL